MVFSHRTISAGLIFILAAALIYNVWRENWSHVFVIGQAILLSYVPLLLERYYNICISKTLRVGIVAFIFATLFLGEVNSFYDQYSWWDNALHFFAGLGLTLIGFSLLVSIYSKSDLRSTPFLTSFFAFSFMGMMASIWEVYEFIIDQTGLAADLMQGDNTDTMIDIIVAIIGGFIVCIGGYRYLRHREKNIAAKIIEETGTNNSATEHAEQ